MKIYKSILSKTVLVATVIFGLAMTAWAGTPETRKDGVTVIHLDQYDGYFSAQETLADLKAGRYEFVVTNKSNKLVGFQIQAIESKKGLDMFPLEPNETKVSKVVIGKDGVRFRCPINPTPWYELDSIK